MFEQSVERLLGRQTNGKTVWPVGLMSAGRTPFRGVGAAAGKSGLEPVCMQLHTLAGRACALLTVCPLLQPGSWCRWSDLGTGGICCLTASPHDMSTARPLYLSGTSVIWLRAGRWEVRAISCTPAWTTDSPHHTGSQDWPCTLQNAAVASEKTYTQTLWH